MYKYKITVFTPTYNRGSLLEKLFQSLQKQSFQNFEWLIVDDGSTDNTQEIVSAWQKMPLDFPLRYYHTPNGGKMRAVNHGLDLANGELFFVVDSDDYLTETALERVDYWANTLTPQQKPDFAGVSGDKIYENGQSVGTTCGGESFDCTALERDKLGVHGDKAEAFFTDVFRKYKFPEFVGEKFITESVVYYRMAKDGYKVRFFNEGIYVCDYLADGLTKNALSLHIHNPKGSMLAAKERLTYPELTNQLKIATIYYCYKGVSQAGYSRKEICEALNITNARLSTALFIGNLHELKKKLLNK